MVKNFFKTLGTVILGVILASIIMFFIFAKVISSLVPDDKPNLKANSVLALDFSTKIPEKSDNIESDSPIGIGGDEVTGLRDILTALQQAKSDDKIKGIYLPFDDFQASGLATLSALRRGIVDFRSSGKFVIAYANAYSQKAYYIASAADKVYVNPMGNVELRGFATEVQFLKGLFDHLGIKTNIFYCGKFKSATEPLRRNDISPENREQLHLVLYAAFRMFLQDIATSRNISLEDARKSVDTWSGRTAEGALAAKLIDGIKFKDEVLDEMKGRLGLGEKDDITTINVTDYFKVARPTIKFSEKTKIAVVYAEGSIVDGASEDNAQIAGERYARLFRKIRKDETIKAVVLRVNSGGGSALASDIMWREIERLKQAGKIVITSMGDVAASGGYYIASNSNKIYAEPNTITGSIGVFGIIPNVREFTQNTLHVTVDTVKTGKYAAMNPLYYDFTPEEGAFIQEGVDTIYSRFKSRVAHGRHMTMDQVEAIAQGHIWLGTKAKEIGLVDELGSLQDAIAEAARQANITEYRITEYPEIASQWEQLMDKLKGGGKKVATDFKTSIVKEEFGALYDYYQNLKYVSTAKGVQMRMPFSININ